MWREIGHEMKIQYIPETYEQIRDWANSYELRAMLPKETNHKLAEITTGLLIYYTPDIMKPFAKKLIIGLMDDRLRTAMLYPPQPSWVYTLINGFFAVRRVLLLNFHLPRYTPIQYVSKEKNEHGRYNINYADNEGSTPRWKVLMVAVVSACEESGTDTKVDQFVVGDSKSEFRV
jgi:hypothetical protein